MSRAGQIPARQPRRSGAQPRKGGSGSSKTSVPPQDPDRGEAATALSVLIAIPVCNEARYLETLLAAVRREAPEAALLVVDDGSSDGTTALLCRLGVESLRHPRNLGKGAALRSALRHARRNGAGWLLTLDGDGQHDPAMLPRFLAELAADAADCIIGNRQARGGSMPWLRQLSNGISSILVSLRGGVRFLDAQCGFRAVRTTLPELAYCREEGFQYETELLLRLALAHRRFRHIVIPTRYHGSASRIRHVTDSLRFLRLFWRSLWW